MSVSDDRTREFAFEVALCASLEADEEWVLGRQLGSAVVAPGRRIADVCAVVPGPQFDERTAITADTIPGRAIESDVGVGRAAYWRDAFDCSPEAARTAVERAVASGFFERERRGAREYVRRTTRYPSEWFSGLVGIENKPDLDAPGALERQLRTDVSLGLFDRVVLATESYVTRAHLNRLPEEVGVWRFDPETGDRTVRREATPLPTDRPGVELVAERPLRTDVAVVSPAEKARARRRVAERAYGKGWRTYDLPACVHADATADGRPRCSQFDRVVDPSRECGAECSAREDGDAPDVDAAALRDDRTPWMADAEGVARRQSGLDRFV